MRTTAAAIVLLISLVRVACAGTTPPEPADLWSKDNLIPWVVGVFDPVRLEPEERAQMLQRLGFKQFAYFFDFEQSNVQAVGPELEALRRHGIKPVAWWFPFYAEDPAARATLEVFKRYNVQPQLWLSPTYRDREMDWRNALPKGMTVPNSMQDLRNLAAADRAAFWKAFIYSIQKYTHETNARSPHDQEQRVQQETDRIAAVAKLVAPYGNKLALYNHGGWSGIMENQLAILERLKRRGVDDVGIVYAFNHVRDTYHDDTVNFPVLWERLQPHVVTIMVTGICFDDGFVIYPSQGTDELAMLKTIQDSGWKGPVAVYAAKSGVAETTLSNVLIGLDWLAAELKRPGSAGPRPFPVVIH